VYIEITTSEEADMIFFKCTFSTFAWMNSDKLNRMLEFIIEFGLKVGSVV
jgi:hypothetical protein